MNELYREYTTPVRMTHCRLSGCVKITFRQAEKYTYVPHHPFIALFVGLIVYFCSTKAAVNRNVCFICIFVTSFGNVVAKRAPSCAISKYSFIYDCGVGTYVTMVALRDENLIFRGADPRCSREGFKVGDIRPPNLRIKRPIA